MASKSTKGYFGMGHLISIIFAIIPVTSLIFGIVTRFTRGKWLGAILNIIIFPLFWIVDIVTIIAGNKNSFLA